MVCIYHGFDGILPPLNFFQVFDLRRCALNRCIQYGNNAIFYLKDTCRYDLHIRKNCRQFRRWLWSPRRQLLRRHHCWRSEKDLQECGRESESFYSRQCPPPSPLRKLIEFQVLYKCPSLMRVYMLIYLGSLMVFCTSIQLVCPIIFRVPPSLFLPAILLKWRWIISLTTLSLVCLDFAGKYTELQTVSPLAFYVFRFSCFFPLLLCVRERSVGNYFMQLCLVKMCYLTELILATII